MLPTWLSKEKISQAKLRLKDLYFSPLRKESAKSPQLMILLAFWEKYSWFSIMRVVVPILCDFQMARLDWLWRRPVWWHRNARIPFHCTNLINKLLFSALPEAITRSRHVHARRRQGCCQSVCVPWTPLCHLVPVFIPQEESIFAQNSTKH